MLRVARLLASARAGVLRVSDSASAAGSAAWPRSWGASRARPRPRPRPGLSRPRRSARPARRRLPSSSGCPARPPRRSRRPARPPSPITASSPPTSTVSSSPATIRCSTPAAGEGISVSTLSVETSSRGSSTSTRSPSCLSQRVTVPSVTLSPRAGIWTVKAMAGRSSCCRAAVRAWVRRGEGATVGQLCGGGACRPGRGGASPKASFWVGWAWIRAATSSASASQL